MGSGNRGQLRPHFSGRSPPFLVAALCIGICILGVSYYSLSTQSSNLESKLANSIQKNADIVSELETSRSQFHVKEEEFGRTKIELEKVKQELQSSRENFETKVKELEELKANDEKLKVDKEECHKNVDKLTSELVKLNTETQEWKTKESKWLEEKKNLEAEIERRGELLKKKPAADEVSNNVVEEGKIDEAKASGDALAKKTPESQEKAIPPPVVDKDKGSAAAAVASSVVKAKDEVAVLPEP